MKNYLISILFLLLLAGCKQEPQEEEVKLYSHPQEFGDYWYKGKAEIASYKLSQARYGEVHDGHAVLIFVTEDFSRSKQVKLDNPQGAGNDRMKVLKLNFTKKFNTGIYPYSIMTSVFSPAEQEGYPMKITMSAQEWCGHVFSQLNNMDNRYEIREYSYFESEGDQSYVLGENMLEDGVWNQIRLNHQKLPVGQVEIIPGMATTRLLHDMLEPRLATTSITSKQDTITYSIKYQDEQQLIINFAKDFPHHIYGWTETVEGVDGQKIRTEASLMDTLIIDYWTKNKTEYEYLRDSLNLKDLR